MNDLFLDGAIEIISKQQEVEEILKAQILITLQIPPMANLIEDSGGVDIGAAFPGLILHQEAAELGGVHVGLPIRAVRKCLHHIQRWMRLFHLKLPRK